MLLVESLVASVNVELIELLFNRWVAKLGGKHCSLCDSGLCISGQSSLFPAASHRAKGIRLVDLGTVDQISRDFLQSVRHIDLQIG